MRLYCKAGAVHDDGQDVPPAVYQADCVLVLPGSRAPTNSDGTYAMPAITPQIRESSIKDECRRRIQSRLSETAQRNLTAYATSLNTIVVAGGSLTAPQIADLTKLTDIFAWISRPDGMLGKSDALIASACTDWWLDAHWPAWNAASWDELVARF